MKTVIAQVEHLLQNVQQIKAADTAFAAILGNGSVVTWGAARLMMFDDIWRVEGRERWDWDWEWASSNPI